MFEKMIDPFIKFPVGIRPAYELHLSVQVTFVVKKCADCRSAIPPCPADFLII